MVRQRNNSPKKKSSPVTKESVISFDSNTVEEGDQDLSERIPVFPGHKEGATGKTHSLGLVVNTVVVPPTIAGIKEFDMGLDISTAVVGVTLLNTNGSLHHMDHVKLNIASLTNIFDKADYTMTWIQKNVGIQKIRKIFVEANAKMFAGGMTSADTLFTLAKMNALISYLTHKYCNAPVFDINVSSARAKLGIKIDRKDKSKSVKEKVREQALILYPNLPIRTHVAKTGKSKGQVIPDKEMEDEIDSFIIARGGQLLHP